jgi:hypothetical protein
MNGIAGGTGYIGNNGTFLTQAAHSQKKTYPHWACPVRQTWECLLPDFQCLRPENALPLHPANRRCRSHSVKKQDIFLPAPGHKIRCSSLGFLVGISFISYHQYRLFRLTHTEAKSLSRSVSPVVHLP